MEPENSFLDSKEMASMLKLHPQTAYKMLCWRQIPFPKNPHIGMRFSVAGLQGKICKTKITPENLATKIRGWPTGANNGK